MVNDINLKCCNQRKLHSEKNELEISKPFFYDFMQNSVLEQAKLTVEGADYMERNAQVKRKPVWLDSLEK